LSCDASSCWLVPIILFLPAARFPANLPVILRVPIVGTDRIDRAPRMLDSLPIHQLTAGLSAEDREGGLQMVGIDRLKNIINNNSLRECRDHSRVLFVQHPAKNGQTRTILRRSFVACAGLYGNSERATEGGI